MNEHLLDADCPYCGEPQSLGVDPADAATGRLVVDCTVCCRPIHVLLRRTGSGTSLEIATEDRD